LSVQLVLSPDQARVAVVGLGYVGLPLAVEFGKVMPTVGYDVDPGRIAELKAGRDSTREVDAAAFGEAVNLGLSSDPQAIAGCNVFIVAVPTPIDRFRQPDLEPLRSATGLVGEMLKDGDLVVFESTVYPGATEEVCVPVLEAASGLTCNRDFYVGYSPERMNPGDRQHRVTDILKVTSGSTPEAAAAVDTLYRKIVRAGTHKVSSIRVAEAAKVIENTQRDVNIALVNELALIFNRLGIDTQEVLDAAGTKWNFVPFRPGLVGGHCIGVDPYYLTHKAQEIGYHPEVILAGRRINDSMGAYVAGQVFGLMSRSRLPVCDGRVLVMGLAFKENCPDLRNTRVIDLIRQLQAWRARVDVYDPCIAAADAQREYGIEPVAQPQPGTYDAIVLAVAHRQFRELGAERIRAFGKPDCVVYDVKGVLPREAVDGRL
jgi:UDP-N-acetyl-D-galactosamine dehydrogenase